MRNTKPTAEPRKKGKATQVLQYEIPVSDLSLADDLARRLGWKMSVAKTEEIKDHRPNKCTQRAMKNVRAGKTIKAESADNLIKQILE